MVHHQPGLPEINIHGWFLASKRVTKSSSILTFLPGPITICLFWFQLSTDQHSKVLPYKISLSEVTEHIFTLKAFLIYFKYKMHSFSITNFSITFWKKWAVYFKVVSVYVCVHFMSSPSYLVNVFMLLYLLPAFDITT